MGEFKGTPGPWRVVPYDAGSRDEWPGTPSIQAPEELDCAIVHWAGFAQRHWQSARGRQEVEANARLIAAAPDLLEALKGLMEAYEALTDGMGVNVKAHPGSRYSHAKAVVARATGSEAK